MGPGRYPLWVRLPNANHGACCQRLSLEPRAGRPSPSAARARRMQGEPYFAFGVSGAAGAGVVTAGAV